MRSLTMVMSKTRIGGSPIWGLPRCERSSEEVQELGSCIRTPRGAHCYARAPRWAQAPSVRIQDPTAGLVPDTSYYGQQRSRPLRQTPVGRRWRGGPTTRCVGSRGLRIRGPRDLGVQRSHPLRETPVGRHPRPPDLGSRGPDPGSGVQIRGQMDTPKWGGPS